MQLKSTASRTSFIKQTAKELGFLHCGIAQADFLEEEAPRLEQWLKQGFQGEMGYMNNYFDKRLDPRKLVPGAKSVVSLAYNYFPKHTQNKDAYQIAKYAYGEDYHFVLKRKLKSFLKNIQENIGEVEGRVFVDSAPVLEKAWAQKSGVGWLGKNGNILSKKVGSFYFLSELIIDLELISDAPTTDHCGKCTACIDACPTGAIEQPYIVNGSKCISYATIELKDNIPHFFKEKMENRLFGCDICQDVCPWNRFSSPTKDENFIPKGDWLSYSKKEWEEITEEVFKEWFKKSALKRTKFEGIKRNLDFLKDRNNQNK